MKAQFEKVMVPEGSSWKFMLRELDAIPFEWHFHPEYELTLTVNSSGERYVGDSIERHGELDLVLTGPNLPHTWQSSKSLDESRSQIVYVLWFSQQWADSLVQQFPEYSGLPALLSAAHRGICFPPALARSLAPEFEALPDANPVNKLLVLLSLLDSLIHSEYTSLASNHFDSANVQHHQQEALTTILAKVHSDYRQVLLLEEMASLANMSVSSFVRFFKRHMKQSFNRYLTQIRIGHACQLLIRTEYPVSLIADQSGFGNQSNFNRLFRKYKNITPIEFRNQHKI
ncbi:AraC family transcriptional regulator [Parasalinivibrio latis]|uniref:AraC family transcriptional regulator n=1 Tax=Parasalinivibrio latis TaxID=2952610 RepID=UPI0030DE648A